jgi:hypothetical protein
MSRGPARRASFNASRYSAWRWRRWTDPGIRRAERARTRVGGANLGAARPVIGCRNFGFCRFPAGHPDWESYAESAGFQVH